MLGAPVQRREAFVAPMFPEPTVLRSTPLKRRRRGPAEGHPPDGVREGGGEDSARGCRCGWGDSGGEGTGTFDRATSRPAGKWHSLARPGWNAGDAGPDRPDRDRHGGHVRRTWVWRQGRRCWTAKVPSTPEDPARAVLAGLEAVGGLPAGGRLHHGSTVGTQCRADPVGRPRGVPDHLGLRGPPRPRPGPTVSTSTRSPPPAPLRWCPPSGAGGSPNAWARTAVWSGPSRRRGSGEAVEEALALGPASVAVCLLHSPRAPRHEQRLAAASARALGPLGVSVHASAEISADGREAEAGGDGGPGCLRGPPGCGLRGPARPRPPSGSPDGDARTGARMTAEEVRRSPVRTLLSGPAAGVAAAHAPCRAPGLPRALSFRRGRHEHGRLLIEGGTTSPWRGRCGWGSTGSSAPPRPWRRWEPEAAGLGRCRRAPRTGPESAGADPGPACYGKGGPFTLTDVWLLLGRLPPALLGEHSPHRSAAERPGGRSPVAPAARRGSPGRWSGGGDDRARSPARLGGPRPRSAGRRAPGLRGAGPLLAPETADLLTSGGSRSPWIPGPSPRRGPSRPPPRRSGPPGARRWRRPWSGFAGPSPAKSRPASAARASDASCYGPRWRPATTGRPSRWRSPSGHAGRGSSTRPTLARTASRTPPAR